MSIFEVIEKRRSIRRFKPEPVKNGDLRKILEAGRLAPSGGNRQPWYFIVVRDAETRRALSIAANNQKFIADAGVIIAALGDPSASSVKMPYTPSTTRISHLQDPMIAIEHMVLAATALGYGTCWIGAFNQEEVKRILKIPENLAVVALLPIGVPDESPPPRPRKAFKEIFFKDSYGVSLEL
ncbi:MAG: nitroreductase family protein [Candidatus Bathyarchaeia archaeon]